MENNNQNIIRQLQEQLDQKISCFHQAEERVRMLMEELSEAKHRQALNEAATEEHIRFDMLLSEISAQFINLPPDQVDREIENAQCRFCQCLGITMSSLWQWSADDPDEILLTHLYRPLGGTPIPRLMKGSMNFPWSFQQLMAGKMYVISSIEELPVEAAPQIDTWRYYGIKSSVGIPLVTGSGRPFGAVSFHNMEYDRKWTDTIVQSLRLVAQIFSNALSRKRSDEVLRESEWRLSIATGAAGAGLWIFELATGKVWVSEKTRELFRISPDEDLNYESLLNTIHPDDRKGVNRAVQQALQSGGALQIDHRILLPDGNIRWISACGRPHLQSTGEPDRIMGVSVDITERKQLEIQLKEYILEIEKLKKRLEHENIYLQKEIKFLGAHKEILGQSPAIKKVLAQVKQAAPTDSTILIQGETGTGKELLARAIHSASSRKNRPMVTVNCSSLPSSLVESELFGREKGAYTGALTKVLGRFEVADGSTLFLDEIGELAIELQAKLLRVLEEGVFERLGSAKPIKVNVRVIAATNRNIEEEVKAGRFRKDLYFRINVFPITIPPLRDRLEDIPLLVRSFVNEFQERIGNRIDSIPKRNIEVLQSYSWPGNIRELKNLIERAIILNTDRILRIPIPSVAFPGSPQERISVDVGFNLDDIERKAILSVLEKTGWRISGEGCAAEVLGMKRTTLQAKMKKLGIQRPKL